MPLVDMKNTEADTNEAEAVGEQSKYPYGLSISLSGESMKKLGLDSTPPNVGQAMTLTATVYVKAMRAEEEQEETCISTELQITEMELTPAAKLSGLGVMYPNSTMS